jgi:hypothetical protein
MHGRRGRGKDMERKDLKLSSWRRLWAGLTLQPSPFLAQMIAAQTLTDCRLNTCSLTNDRHPTNNHRPNARSTNARSTNARSTNRPNTRSMNIRSPNARSQLAASDGNEDGDREMNPTWSLTPTKTRHQSRRQSQPVMS